MKQVLINLTGNAIKYTDNGFVEIKVVKTEELIDKIKLKFLVFDTGIGISQNEFDKLFKNFSQIEIRRKNGGTGLGLAICKNLIELLGGSIGVDSVPGQGSIFWFTVWLSKDIRDNCPGRCLSSQSSLVYDSLNILLAEDNYINQRLIEAFARKKGWNITVVGNGRQAVESLKKENFNLILMDVAMPVMDGLEATRIIRETDCKIPIVALTAYAMQGDEDMCLKAGMNAYISKPVKPDVLYNTILKVLNDDTGSVHINKNR